MKLLKHKKRIIDLGDVQKHEAPLGDRNLLPMHFRNIGKSVVYCECVIHEYFPIYKFGNGPGQINPCPSEWRVVEIKPGEVKMLPHRYYKTYTRDASKVELMRHMGIDAIDPI